MRWIGFILLIGLAVVLQSTVLPWIRIHRIGPDLLFLVAVYYLLQAAPAEALLAAWAAGLTLDLFSDVRLGTFAVSFGLVGLAVIRMREMLFKDHPLTQLVVALIGCGLSQVLARVINALLEPSLRWGLADVLLGALYTALYTAILAPYVLWLLDRFRDPLGLKPADRLRRRSRR